MTSGTGASDGTTAREAREAYAKLCDELLPLARRETRSRDDAWDALHTLLMRLQQRGVDPLGKDLPGLRKAVRHCCADVRRGKARHRAAMERWAAERLLLRASIPTPARHLEQERARELVEAVLAALPQGQREALLYTKMKDMTYAEAAEALGCSESNVRNQVHKAMKRARTMLRNNAIECLDDV